MSKLSDVMAKVVADLRDKYSAEHKERPVVSTSLAKPATPQQPTASNSEADHETARGIRSVWD